MDNKIEYTCKCGKTVIIKIKTIDTLKESIARLQKENAGLRKLVSSLTDEHINKRKEENVDTFLSELRKAWW